MTLAADRISLNASDAASLRPPFHETAVDLLDVPDGSDNLRASGRLRPRRYRSATIGKIGIATWLPANPETPARYERGGWNASAAKGH